MTDPAVSIAGTPSARVTRWRPRGLLRVGVKLEEELIRASGSRTAKRLFRTCAEVNFIEPGSDTSFLQTGEARYGRPLDLRSMTTELGALPHKAMACG